MIARCEIKHLHERAGRDTQQQAGVRTDQLTKQQHSFFFGPFVMRVYCFPALNGAYERKQSRVTDQQTSPHLSLVTWQIKGNK